VVEHSSFEPRPQVATQVWTRREFSEQGVMRDAVEAFFDGGIQDILGFLANGRENGGNRIVTRAPWAKAITVRFETRLPLTFEGAFHSRVVGSVSHGRHAQWSLVRRARFWEPDTSDGGSSAIESEGLCQCEALWGC
jgi:hypothetical protein